MRQDIKEEWVADLLDPNAKQGRGKLGDSEGRRCCLGVLCDIAVRHGVIPPPRRMDDGGLEYGVHPDEMRYEDDDGYLGDWVSDGELPRKVAMWAELPDEEQSVPMEGAADTVHLAGINDGIDIKRIQVRPHTFAEIAAIIKERL